MLREIYADTQRHVKLVAGNAHRGLAEDLASELSLSVEPADVASFADGETHVHIGSDVREATVFIVQPTCAPVNDHLMALALLIDAARAAGAARITAIVPYFGYARQDQRSSIGDPRSAQIVARLLGAVGLDHLITVDLHTTALESAFSMPITLLRPEQVFVARIESWGLSDLVVVAPDAGGLKRAQRYAATLSADVAVTCKERPRADAAAIVHVLGDVRDRTCLLVDDMASTGRTLAGAAEALRRAGAREVHAIFTHAVMVPGALERLVAAPLERLATTDSIPIPGHARLEVVRIAPLLAETVHHLAEPSLPSPVSQE
jgi:ribose-phosphate pyrophosphokinase